MSRTLSLALLAILVTPYRSSTAQAAPSFLCTGKLSPIETAICTDPLLGNADMRASPS